MTQTVVKLLLSGFILAASASEFICDEEKKRLAAGERVTSCLRKQLQTAGPFELLNATKGPLTFSEGLLYDVHKFYVRHEPQVGCIGSKLHVELLLGLEDTKVRYRWKTHGLPIRGTSWTFVRRTTVAISLTAGIYEGTPVTLENLRMTEHFAPWVVIEGYEPFAWFASKLGSFVTKANSNVLQMFMEKNYAIIVGKCVERCFV